jgi:hypothetical protein
VAISGGQAEKRFGVPGVRSQLDWSVVTGSAGLTELISG